MPRTMHHNTCAKCRIIFDKRNGNACTDYNRVSSHIGCDQYAACPKVHKIMVCRLYYTIGCRKSNSECNFSHPKCIHTHLDATAITQPLDGISCILAASQATAWA